MWILGLKGLICKRLFRALDKVSLLLLRINLLIKMVFWSFFGPKKGWQITWAPPQGRGWGCAAGWGRTFMTGLTKMGWHFQWSY